MPIQFPKLRNISGKVFTFGLLFTLLVLPLAGCKGSQEAGANNPQLQQAKRLIDEGNFEAAFIQLNQALNEAPTDPNVHLNLAWLYLYTDNLPHAEKELKQAETLGPDLAETYHLRGSVFQYKAQLAEDPEQKATFQEKAIENFNEALQRNKENYQTYFDLATSLSATNEQEKALTALDKGFEYIPTKDLETQVNFQIASCSARAKLQLYEEAIQDCAQALKFTTSPASRDRIEAMIENMKLMNPTLRPKLEQLQNASAEVGQTTEEDAEIDATASA